MCETRDLGMTWSQWHTLRFHDEVGAVCPQNVKKMLLQQARKVRWKKWSSKREELKEGVWRGPVQAMLRRKASEWTEAPTCDEDMVVGAGAAI